MRRFSTLALAAAFALLALSADADAGLFRKKVVARPTAATTCQGAQCQARQVTVATPTYRVTTTTTLPVATQATPQVQVQVSADPNGFLGWLNATRAQYGLGAVGWDQNLANWAAQNNAQQNARGIGHFIMGPARRQNAAMGGHSLGQRWMNSPGHRAALLDPSIRFIGLSGSGVYWTFNAY